MYEIINKIEFDGASNNEILSNIASKHGFDLVSEIMTNGFAEFRFQRNEKIYGVVHLLIGKQFDIPRIRNIFMKSVFCGQIFFLR